MGVMDDTHYGTKKWDGHIKTLCGVTLPPCKWVPGKATCRDCRRIKGELK